MAEESLQYADKQYEVSLPWKKDPRKMKDNYQGALKRLVNTENRLMRNPEVAKAYGDTIKRYEENDYIRKVPKVEENSEGHWYLPHFPVIKPGRSTTKVRIVFDASAKFHEVSLNDFTYQGPKVGQDLFDVLLRFRRNPIAMVCDIAEMYLRIKIKPEDRPYHRFLWRDLQSNKPPDQYEFNRVVFDVNSSPFLAQYVSRKNAENHEHQYPLAAKTVKYSTYMDDSMDSVKDVKTAVELYHQLLALWGKAGMHARKWMSNSSEVLQIIPEENRSAEINLKDGELPAIKTLGISWKAAQDTFHFQALPQDEDGSVYTKRKVLSKIATLLDPLGFLSPFILRPKIIMQKMWVDGRTESRNANKSNEVVLRTEAFGEHQHTKMY